MTAAQRGSAGASRLVRVSALAGIVVSLWFAVAVIASALIASARRDHTPRLALESDRPLARPDGAHTRVGGRGAERVRRRVHDDRLAVEHTADEIRAVADRQGHQGRA